MRLSNEFTIDAPLEQTWALLLDMRRVAACLPGAKLEDAGADGVYRGTMKVKLGPITTTYRGAARLQEVDVDTRTASIAVDAREQQGQGTATAVVTNRLEPANGGTRVLAETDLSITGRPAQFGRGIIEDVAGQMLGDFARSLEDEVLASGPHGTSAAPAPREPEDADVLDLGRMLPRTAVKGVAIGTAVLVAAAVAVRLVARRRPRGR
jgi:carbon monoxide dehydrogenase subunit G